MPIFLKDIKRSLERDLGKVGKKPNGKYKFTPPNIVARKLNSYPGLPVSNADGTANTKDGAVMFTGLVQSQSSTDKYKVFAKFFDVAFSAEPTDSHTEKAEVFSGGHLKDVYHAPIGVRKCRVALRCHCSDFRHRFMFPLAEVDALVGQPIKYTRKTPAWPVGNPYANSTEKIGICKHLWAFLNELNRLGMVEE